jgi:ribosomal protein L34
MALLERIDTEYGQTVAARRARKAREQLGAATPDEGQEA